MSLDTLQGFRPPLGGTSEKGGETGAHFHAGCATYTHLRRVVNQAGWRLKAQLCQTKGESPPVVKKERECTGLPANYFSPNRFTSPTVAKERRLDLRKIRESTAKPPKHVRTIDRASPYRALSLCCASGRRGSSCRPTNPGSRPHDPGESLWTAPPVGKPQLSSEGPQGFFGFHWCIGCMPSSAH